MKGAISKVAAQRLQGSVGASRHIAGTAILLQYSRIIKAPSSRRFSYGACLCVKSRALAQSSENGEQDSTTTNGSDFDDAIARSKEKQIRTPWHREGSSLPPVSRPRRASAMVKGKLLTTPSRLLKLILPLTKLDKNTDRKDVEPLALLVHPQQPLSYLERLIQSELPTIKKSNGDEKIPSVYFRAEDSTQDEIESSGGANEDADPDGFENKQGHGSSKPNDDEKLEKYKIDGKLEKTGVLNRHTTAGTEAAQLRGGPGEGGVETYSGDGREADAPNGDRNFVRWSSSTEVGDFIRDAARGKEFGVEIEGAPSEIRVGVPSFGDRTHYLRQRLRRVSNKLSNMTSVKQECDKAAQRGAQRVAMSGFAGLCTWWGAVYFLTFQTSLGWDTMEPVTYLVGLSGLMGGYLWFLYHNREISYRAALNITISRRQAKLYQAKNFDLEKWENLIHEGNDLRKEIKAVATEYDVEWDEKKDTNAEVAEALKKDREKEAEEEDEEKSSDKDDKKKR